MKPGHLDLPTVWRGCTYPAFTLTWLGFNGLPIDLTLWTPYARSVNIDFHPAVTDPINGVTTISLASVETEGLDLGVEQWDWVWINNLTGYVTPPLLAGTVPIKEPVTPTIVPAPPVLVF